jgi:uncharacterized protein
MGYRIDRRTGLEELDRDECLRLLARCSLGRVGIVVSGRPLMFPVNFTLDGEAVVFRSNGRGHQGSRGAQRPGCVGV